LIAVITLNTKRP